MEEGSGYFFWEFDAGSENELEAGEQVHNSSLNVTKLPCYSGWLGVCHECNGQGSCICKRGFSGDSDFIPMDRSRWGGITLTCPNYEPVLIAMYAIALVLGVEVIWRTCTNLRFQLELVNLQQHSNKVRLSTWAMLGFLVTLIVNLSFVLLKLAFPEQITGIDLAPTLLHVWRANGLYCADQLHKFRIFNIAVRAQTASIGRRRVLEKTIEQRKRSIFEASAWTLFATQLTM
eukprot:5851961-Pleurochrysis_carterae.AAC.3